MTTVAKLYPNSGKLEVVELCEMWDGFEGAELVDSDRMLSEETTFSNDDTVEDFFIALFGITPTLIEFDGTIKVLPSGLLVCNEFIEGDRVSISSDARFTVKEIEEVPQWTFQ